jgi:hypothetical protein
MIESPMKPVNKNLYRQPNIRNHLCSILFEADKNLREQAFRRFSKEKFELLNHMLRTLNGEPPSQSDFINSMVKKEEQSGALKIEVKEEINVKRLYNEIKSETDFDTENESRKIVCKEENH